MRELILKLADEGDFYEIQKDFAAQHPHRLHPARRARPSASSPTSRWSSPAASTSTHRRKAARFVRFCDAFEIPILTLVDVPGFLPGIAQELAASSSTAPSCSSPTPRRRCPRSRVITRKAYGGAYDVMASKHLRRRRQLRLAHRRNRRHGRQGRGRDPLPGRTRRPRHDRRPHRRNTRTRFANPFVAAERGFIDEVIMPHSTRRRVARAFAALAPQEAREPLEEA